ncbi:hypothetical protein ASPACDRAFT_1858701 [Aspergillus aculeatus ATCC 16872]|uniref:Cyanovirin-N domain-containing protein n=1 Tax=Aspergillus aculeatus (strain ATCC 16872 / CBS 172.66 / WB 5094) TaxID=690307 RepID=A0A1L9WM52_ASPA1|nr:uncharacterized protein ASPACDRAFT_1858701 [Aspergillus aculeatus ATCC 16872]OJJ97249.1 hypothetical protein ASPACDRAFT_1858701 [Aspergillus aculeatus ATCC 16872]
MSFAHSCQNIRLEDGHILACSAPDRNGNLVEARLDLDVLIGNEDGTIFWDGQNFSHSAQNITLEGSLLTADLPARDGSFNERQGIDLGERISNEDGRLVYI